MIAHTAACPHCGREQRFEPLESQIVQDPLPYLKQSPYSAPDTPGSADHQLYGYVLSRCPGCRSDLIIHFNIVLHVYLALLQQHFPREFAADAEVSAQALLQHLDGELAGVAVEPSVDVIDL